MKMNNIYRIAVLMLGATMLATSCIQEPIPLTGTTTQDRIEQDPESEIEHKSNSMHTILIKNTVTGEDFDFGLPSLYAQFDRSIGEVLPSTHIAEVTHTTTVSSTTHTSLALVLVVRAYWYGTTTTSLSRQPTMYSNSLATMRSTPSCEVEQRPSVLTTTSTWLVIATHSTPSLSMQITSLH